jgi:hypothetical protein
MWQRQSPPEQGGRDRSCEACGSAGAVPSREAGSRAAGHVVAPRPSKAGRQGPKPRGTWQRRSLPEQGGGVQNREARGSVGASPSKETRSRAAGHVAALELSRAVREGPELWGTW